MTHKLVPVEQLEALIAIAEMNAEADEVGSDLWVTLRILKEASPTPPISQNYREEVARAIKHCFDTGKTRFDQITDAAISTLQGLGWGKK